MPIKIIATDLDGTLMSPDHETITERTIKTLKIAHDKGVKIALATGRPLSLLDNVTDQLPFADYLIYANGACVYDRSDKKIIYSNLIDGEISALLITQLLKNEVFFEIYLDGESHYQLGTEDYFVLGDLPKDFIDHATSTMTGHTHLVDFLNGRGVEKITLYSTYGEKYEKLEKLFLSYQLETASSFDGNLEATAPNTDKSTALEGVCRLLQIDKTEAMAFGDAGNDCPMLRWAYYSFAMGNATDECKNAARYVTLSNAEDGLAVAVEEYVL